MKKIVLVGYMGSGKSTIGKLLAQNLGILFLDLDDVIAENQKMSISQIFKIKGEIYFRNIESKLFQSLAQSDQNFVLALGGGTPCYANNHLLLQDSNCQSFYLQTKMETLVQRLTIEKENRPIIAQLSDSELIAFVGQHLLERNYYYRFSKHTINTDGLSSTDIAQKINSEIM